MHAVSKNRIISSHDKFMAAFLFEDKIDRECCIFVFYFCYALNITKDRTM